MLARKGARGDVVVEKLLNLVPSIVHVVCMFYITHPLGAILQSREKKVPVEITASLSHSVASGLYPARCWSALQTKYPRNPVIESHQVHLRACRQLGRVSPIDASPCAKCVQGIVVVCGGLIAQDSDQG